MTNKLEFVYKSGADREEIPYFSEFAHGAGHGANSLGVAEPVLCADREVFLRAPASANGASSKMTDGFSKTRAPGVGLLSFLRVLESGRDLGPHFL
jgi:hypothetical protein